MPTTINLPSSAADSGRGTPVGPKTTDQRVIAALDFAGAAHGNQRYGTQPYMFHVEHVVQTVVELGFSSIEHRIVAALHDVLEDTAVTFVELQQRFGQTIAAAVQQLTKIPGASAEQNTLGLGKLAFAVKLADRISNVAHLDFGTAEQIAYNKRRLLPRYLSETPTFRQHASLFGKTFQPALKRLDSELKAVQTRFAATQRAAPCMSSDAYPAWQQFNGAATRPTDNPQGPTFNALALQASQPVALPQKVPTLAALQALARSIEDRLGERPSTQCSSNIDELYRVAAFAEAELQHVTAQLAKATSGRAVFAPGIKLRERALQRMECDFGGDAAYLTDIVRSTLAYGSLQQLHNALQTIAASCDIVRIKNRFATPFPDGYRDVLLNIRLSNGHIAEVQLHVESMLDVAHHQGRALYEQAREVIGQAAAENRPLSAPELATLSALNTQSQKLFNAAYETALSAADMKSRPPEVQRDP